MDLELCPLYPQDSNDRNPHAAQPGTDQPVVIECMSYEPPAEHVPDYMCYYKFTLHVLLYSHTCTHARTHARTHTHTHTHTHIYISGGPLSALTCCINVRLLSAIKKISPLIYSQSWVGSWVYTTQAMMTFTLIF